MSTRTREEILQAARLERKTELGYQLLGDNPEDDRWITGSPERPDSLTDAKLNDPVIRGFVSGADLLAEPEFVEHQCWRMLMVWPDEADPSIPGTIQCGGCGAVFRAELEYRP